MAESHSNALVVGGSSGLGFELACLLGQRNVFTTGRRDPRKEGHSFSFLDLNSRNYLEDDLTRLVARIPEIDLLVYAAGFYQEGRISDLSDTNISDMAIVGLLAPAMLLRRILKKQNSLSGFIAITSTSQWTPRLGEPMYTAVKAGLGMLANSVSLDERVKKVLIAGPAGMRTSFWRHNPRDMQTMLDPKWVAEEILAIYAQDFSYQFIRILREPPRVEVVEMRR